MKEYRCFRCGYKTLDTRGEFDICPVCFWENDAYLDFSKNPITCFYTDREPAIRELLEIPSGANHGLTVRKAQENYQIFGAGKKHMLPHVRKP